jgi:hypothetical protein
MACTGGAAASGVARHRSRFMGAIATLVLLLAACGEDPTGTSVGENGLPENGPVNGGGGEEPTRVAFALDAGQEDRIHLEASARVSGTATPGATISLDEGGGDARTTADASGAWSLPVELTEGENRLTLRASLDGFDDATLSLVLRHEPESDVESSP